jgi:hypothetical protein
MVASSHPGGSLRIRCGQCWRVGTRGFKTLNGCVHEPSGTVIDGIVICAAEKACRQRRESRRFLGWMGTSTVMARGTND